MGKLGFFVVGNSKGKFRKDGGREVSTHVAWYRKATGADLGQGQDDHWETQGLSVYRGWETSRGRFSRMLESSDFQLNSFFLHPEMLASRLHFFIDHHCD